LLSQDETINSIHDHGEAVASHSPVMTYFTMAVNVTVSPAVLHWLAPLSSQSGRGV
jgi:hypothetical protein